MLRPLFVAVVASFVTCSTLAVAVEPAPAAKQFVEVKFWVVEVSTTKLRNLGFDWQGLDKSSKTDDPSKQLGFLVALEENNLARIPAKADMPEAKRRFVTASATEVASGKVTLLSETNCQERRTDGKPNDTKLLVFAQATIGK